MGDIHTSGFKEVTRLGAARERLRDTVTRHERTERLPLSQAIGRTLAVPVDTRINVPHYARAAMDGYAVRAEDTFGASDRSPGLLQLSGKEIDPGEAIRVHTGSEIPPGADAVVMIEHVERVEEEIDVFDSVTVGENVAAVGEDVEAGQRLYEPGHRLRPSDLGLLKATGVDEVETFEQPLVSVIPTGEELVQTDPDPGEVIETNGLTVSRYVERWGGSATYRDVVTDDREALRAAIQRDLTKDLVVTTGGSSVGERDLVPEIVDGLGEVFIHGVALKPGHPVALGVVEDTPVLMLPGYPVSCIITAVQFLRPAIAWSGGFTRKPHPTTTARLDRKLTSEPGTRTFARVRLHTEDDETVAEPTRTSGAGVLSSVALADGWVGIPEGAEGIPAGETVEVQDWEWYP